jgi:hypothetical protein
MRQKRISDTIPKVDDEGVRQSQRVPLTGTLSFLQPEGVTGEAVDANADGMRVVTDAPLRPGDKCIAVVQLASGDSTHERMEVIWSRRSARGWEAGLRFAG